MFYKLSYRQYAEPQKGREIEYIDFYSTLYTKLSWLSCLNEYNKNEYAKVPKTNGVFWLPWTFGVWKQKNQIGGWNEKYSIN